MFGLGALELYVCHGVPLALCPLTVRRGCLPASRRRPGAFQHVVAQWSQCRLSFQRLFPAGGYAPMIWSWSWLSTQAPALPSGLSRSSFPWGQVSWWRERVLPWDWPSGCGHSWSGEARAVLTRGNCSATAQLLSWGEEASVLAALGGCEGGRAESGMEAGSAPCVGLCVGWAALQCEVGCYQGLAGRSAASLGLGTVLGSNGRRPLPKPRRKGVRPPGQGLPSGEPFIE